MARAAYTEKGDKAQDAKLMRSMSPAQKAEFKKLDEKHRKVKYQDQDSKIDRRLASKAKKSVAKKKG
jgi:hypothetical protein